MLLKTREEYLTEIEAMSEAQLKEECKRMGVDATRCNTDGLFNTEREAVEAALLMAFERWSQRELLLQRMCRLRDFHRLNAPCVVLEQERRLVTIAILSCEPIDVALVLTQFEQVFQEYRRQSAIAAANEDSN